jgi:membrane associated rhomboid family serine protease
MSLFIIILTVIISLLSFNNTIYYQKLIYSPYRVKEHNEWTRIITHAFIHANWTHLLFNMMVLYFFGDNVIFLLENKIGVNGQIGFAFLYLGGILFSSISAYARHGNNEHYLSLGASGAVSAVLYAFIIMAPTSSMYLYFIPIPIPAFIIGIAYLWYEARLDKNSNDGIAHDAHFWGAIFGVLFVIVLKPSTMLDFVNQVYVYIVNFF